GFIKGQPVTWVHGFKRRAEWGCAIYDGTVGRTLVVVVLVVVLGSGFSWAIRQRPGPVTGGVPGLPVSQGPAVEGPLAAAAGPAAIPAATPPEPIAERFIRTRLINDDGTLRTTLSPLTQPDDDVAWGEEALSESLGLWMLYLYERGDEA